MSQRIPRGEGLSAYDEAFYGDHLPNRAFFEHFAAVLIGLLKDPSSARAVDVGCGHGLLVEALRAAGLAESWGREGSPSAEALWPPEQRANYSLVDLRDPAAAAVIPPTEIVCCLEVGEHLPMASAPVLPPGCRIWIATPPM